MSAETVNERRLWYRDQYRRMVTVTLVSLCALMASVALNIVQALIRPDPIFVPLTPDLRIVEPRPLDQAAITQAGLLNWTAETVTRTFSLNFRNWKDQLNDMRPRYSSSGYRSVYLAMQQAGIIGDDGFLARKRLILSATLTAAGRITGSGVVAGRRVWRVEVPMALTYESSEATVSTQKVIAIVDLRRADIRVKPSVIEVNKIVVKPAAEDR